MIIQELKPSKRVRDRWLAVLEDGSILRLNRNQIADFALYTGRELSDEEADRLLEAIENENFRSYALRVVTDTPKSRKMLLKILEEKDCQPEQAEKIAEWLEKLGYLNDRQYAAEVAAFYARKGYGVRKIRDELYRRGVPREFWEDAMDEREPDSGQIDKLARQKLRGAEPTRENLKKVSDYLARRGYGWDEISGALDRLREEEWE